MAIITRAAVTVMLILLIEDSRAVPSQRSRFLPQYYFKRFELSDSNIHTSPKESVKNEELKLGPYGRQKDLSKGMNEEGYPKALHPYPPLMQKSYVPVLRSDTDYSTTSDQVSDEFETRERRKFPEVDSRGFDEDIFDEGFGEWQPMKRW